MFTNKELYGINASFYDLEFNYLDGIQLIMIKKVDIATYYV